MINPLARFRQSGSLVAGFLIGLAVVVAVFALADADSGAGQSPRILGAAGVFVLGLALQLWVTAKPLHRVAADTGREARLTAWRSCRSMFGGALRSANGMSRLVRHAVPPHHDPSLAVGLEVS